MFHPRKWIELVLVRRCREAAGEVGTVRLIAGIMAFCLILFGPNVFVEAAVQALPGVVIGHNGNNTSGFGTGQVDVDFNYSLALTLGPHRANFNEIASHRAEFEFSTSDGTAMLADAFITNSSGIAWSGFVIRLEGADFGGHQPTDVLRATTIDPVADIGNSIVGLNAVSLDRLGIQHWPPFDQPFSLSNSTLVRSNDQGSGYLDAELTINFNDPVIDQRIFYMRYNILPPLGNPSATGFVVTMTPIPVPEPATAALLGVGLLGCFRKRHGVTG